MGTVTARKLKSDTKAELDNHKQEFKDCTNNGDFLGASLAGMATTRAEIRLEHIDELLFRLDALGFLADKVFIDENQSNNE